MIHHDPKPSITLPRFSPRTPVNFRSRERLRLHCVHGTRPEATTRSCVLQSFAAWFFASPQTCAGTRKPIQQSHWLIKPCEEAIYHVLPSDPDFEAQKCLHCIACGYARLLSAIWSQRIEISRSELTYTKDLVFRSHTTLTVASD